MPLGEGHLRRAIGEYLVHYHGERNHQGLDNVLLKGAPAPANENGRVLRRERLGLPDVHPAIASAEATAIPVASFRFIDYYLLWAPALLVPRAFG